MTTKLVRSFVGTVVKDAKNKSVTVVIERKVKHPLLGKVVKKFKKYYAHDENNQFKAGDVVTMVETKPLSKTKTWLVQGLVEKV